MQAENVKRKKFFTKKRLKLLQKWFFFLLGVIVAAIMILPLFWMIVQSLQSDPLAIYQNPPVFPDPPSIASYKEVFASWDFPRLFLNTMTIMVGVMALTLFSSLFVGYGFARLRGRGKNIMFALLMSTMMLPWAVTLIPSYAIWSSLNCLGTYWPLILLSIGGGAFNIFLVRMFIMNIPRSLDEAAVIDGGNKIQVLLYVLLPQLAPVFATIIVFTFNGIWNDYVSPYTYLWGNSTKYTLSIQLAISFKSEFGLMDWPKFMAAAVVISIPVIFVTFFAQSAFTRGITMTGLKD